MRYLVAILMFFVSFGVSAQEHVNETYARKINGYFECLADAVDNFDRALIRKDSNVK